MKKDKPDDFEQILNEKMLTITEAQILACEKLSIGKEYFNKFVRPKLNPRPMLVDQKKKRVGSLKISQSEVEQVIYEIKKKTNNRS